MVKLSFSVIVQGKTYRIGDYVKTEKRGDEYIIPLTTIQGLLKSDIHYSQHHSHEEDKTITHLKSRNYPFKMEGKAHEIIREVLGWYSFDADIKETIDSEDLAIIGIYPREINELFKKHTSEGGTIFNCDTFLLDLMDDKREISKDELKNETYDREKIIFIPRIDKNAIYYIWQEEIKRIDLRPFQSLNLLFNTDS